MNYSDPVDPYQAGELLSQWAGGVIGRFALDESSVTHSELMEAVSVSLTLSAQTLDEIFNLRNGFVVDLFCSP